MGGTGRTGHDNQSLPATDGSPVQSCASGGARHCDREMTPTEYRWRNSLSRRRALAGLAGFLAGSSGLRGQQDTFRAHPRVPGLDEMQDVFDFEAVAYERLDRATYNYTARGGGSEFTLRRNREAFEWARLVPRLTGPAGVPQTATEILGTPMQFPLMLAPTAAHVALHPDKEEATYEGATEASATPLIVSHVSSMKFADLARLRGGPLWYQLYPRMEIEQNREPCAAAEAAGADAIVVTVDQQATSYDRAVHDRNLSLRRSRAPRLTGNAGRYRFSSTRLWYDWTLFDQLRSMVGIPLLIKGVLTGEDATIAVERGLDGIVVSNHGGRTLDYTPSTLEVLPEIVDAVGSRVPVLIDSGFRRGSDILKALALGANAVCVGRAYRWGLGSFGAPGVRRVLEILQDELTASMRRCGIHDLAAASRSLVMTDFP